VEIKNGGMEIRGFKSNVLFKRNLNKFRSVCLVLLSDLKTLDEFVEKTVLLKKKFLGTFS
jgi:hypothetical protein